MKRIFSWVLDNPKKIFIIYIIAAIICGICLPFIAVNYDITKYLPRDSKSTVAIDVLDKEFPGGIPNCRVMVKDISITEALELKEKLKDAPGVIGITWLDDQEDITMPLRNMAEGSLDTYYKDGNALFSLTISSDDTVGSIDAIQKIAGEEALVTGEAGMIAEVTVRTVKEIPLIALGGISFAIFILLFTTNSWVEPFMVMGGLGVAVLLNAGSNIIFGEISFVTNSAGSVLQLAVSLDYSVFLIRRFEEEKKNAANSKEAMLIALEKSVPSIAASGLTTAIGFLALIFMRYRIGFDLGLALAKGVLISLIVVFTFMPVVILALEGIINKTKHRELLPSFKGFSKAVYSIRQPLLIAFVVILVPAFLAYGANTYYYGSAHIYEKGTAHGDKVAQTEEIFGVSGTYVLMVPSGDRTTEQKLSNEIHTVDYVNSILSYVDTVGKEVPSEYLDEDTLSLLESKNYSRMVINLSVPEEGPETFDCVDSIRAIAEKYYPGTWYLAGSGASIADLRDAIQTDILKVNLIGALAVLIVLIFTFKSALLPFLLILTIEWAIWFNFAIPYFKGSTLFFFVYLIVSSIQLGATVDYAILFTDRYLEFRKDRDKNGAALAILENCTPSILTSGLVLSVTGLMMYLISSHGIISQMGYYIATGTLLSMAAVIFVVPGGLALFDRMIVKEGKAEEPKAVEIVTTNEQIEKEIAKGEVPLYKQFKAVNAFIEKKKAFEAEREKEEAKTVYTEEIKKEIAKGEEPVYKQFKIVNNIVEAEKAREEKKQIEAAEEKKEQEQYSDELKKEIARAQQPILKEIIHKHEFTEAEIREELDRREEPRQPREKKKALDEFLEEKKKAKAAREYKKIERQDKLEEFKINLTSRVDRIKEDFKSIAEERKKKALELERKKEELAKAKRESEKIRNLIMQDSENYNPKYDSVLANQTETKDIHNAIADQIEHAKDDYDRFDLGDFAAKVDKEMEQLWPKDLFKDF